MTYESMHGDIINHSTASVIFIENIVKPNCAYRSPFCESATPVLYAQNTSTPGSTFGSMCSKLINNPVLFVKDNSNTGRAYKISSNKFLPKLL